MPLEHAGQAIERRSTFDDTGWMVELWAHPAEYNAFIVELQDQGWDLTEPSINGAVTTRYGFKDDQTRRLYISYSPASDDRDAMLTVTYVEDDSSARGRA